MGWFQLEEAQRFSFKEPSQWLFQNLIALGIGHFLKMPSKNVFIASLGLFVLVPALAFRLKSSSFPWCLYIGCIYREAWYPLSACIFPGLTAHFWLSVPLIVICTCPSWHFQNSTQQAGEPFAMLWLGKLQNQVKGDGSNRCSKATWTQRWKK